MQMYVPSLHARDDVPPSPEFQATRYARVSIPKSGQFPPAGPVLVAPRSCLRSEPMSGVISTLCKFDVAACVEVTQRPLLPRTDS